MVATRGMAAALQARVQREGQRRQMVNAAMQRMARRSAQSQDRDQRREERDEDRARYDTEQKQKQVMDALKVQEADKKMQFEQVLAAAERARPGQGQAFAARAAEIYGPGAGEMVGGIADAASTKYEQAQADEKRKQVLHRLKMAEMMHKMRRDMAGGGEKADPLDPGRKTLQEQKIAEGEREATAAGEPPVPNITTTTQIKATERGNKLKRAQDINDAHRGTKDRWGKYSGGAPASSFAPITLYESKAKWAVEELIRRDKEGDKNAELYLDKLDEEGNEQAKRYVDEQLKKAKRGRSWTTEGLREHGGN